MIHTTETPLPFAAVEAAEKGWQVFRLNGKKPLRGSRGFKDATDDPAVVQKWWEENPDANIGLWPGPSGLLVIDIDGPEGRATMRELGLDEIETLTVETGRSDGGRHLYFRHPGGEIGNAELGPGVEVRADRGYVVLPPSVHPETGERYRWAIDLDPVELPESVVTLIRNGRDPDPTGDPDGGEEEVWEEGTRNNRLTSVAGALRRKGMDARAILAALLKINETQCSPPLPREEVERIARGMERYAPEADPEWILEGLGVADLNTETTPQNLQAFLERVKEWRANGPAQTLEGTVGEAVRKALKEAGADRPAELWEATGRRSPPKNPDTGPDPAAADPEVRREAERLLASRDLLREMIEYTDSRGHVGEETNRRAVFLAAVAGHTARTHEDAIHLVVKGDSASGKNELLRRVLLLLPQHRVRFLAGVSEQGLVYFDGVIEGVLVFQEAAGQEHAEYQIRLAMSEGRLERLTVKDGQSHTVETYVKGSVFTTTTAVSLHDENQTRVFDLHTDDSAELTRQVIRATAREAEGLGAPDEAVRRGLWVWRVALNKLKPGEVVIPYASIIADRFPDHPVRARRDIKRVFALLRACAILHQKVRERDGQDRIICAVDDYRMVYPLVQRILGSSMSGLTEKARQIAELQDELATGYRTGEWVDRAKVQKEAHARGVASEKTVRKWSKHFVEMGVWERRMESGKVQHRVLRNVTEEPLDLPAPDALVEFMESQAAEEDETGPEASKTTDEGESPSAGRAAVRADAAGEAA